jgi:aminoglycoside 3-N-acetyltransferase I
MRTKRLTLDDRDAARALFAVMAEVFGEESEELSDGYVDRLLVQENFWALAAFVGDRIVGGLTAHTVPMTRAESSEIMIYDVAVRTDHQRQGVGRQLITDLRALASAAGVSALFVPVDSEDAHALDFYRSLGGAPAPAVIVTFETG